MAAIVKDSLLTLLLTNTSQEKKERDLVSMFLFRPSKKKLSLKVGFVHRVSNFCRGSRARVSVLSLCLETRRLSLCKYLN